MIHTPTDSGRAAADMFRLFKEGDPDLVDLGIPAIQETIGGMFPGNMVGIGMAQNTGKSSLLLSMGALSKDLMGVIECEDGPDVWGARLLAYHTGIQPTRIRKKELTSEETRTVAKALDEGLAGPLIEYAIGASRDQILSSAEKLLAKGCRIIALNYLQKVRGHNVERRIEVGETLSALLRACAPDESKGRPGAVPVAVSQLVRLPCDKEPQPFHMKETGDIEAECRLIVMGWRDPSDNLTLRCKVAKSSFGGGGLRFAYQYTDAEYLVPADDEEEEEGDEF